MIYYKPNITVKKILWILLLSESGLGFGSFLWQKQISLPYIFMLNIQKLVSELTSMIHTTFWRVKMLKEIFQSKDRQKTNFLIYFNLKLMLNIKQNCSILSSKSQRKARVKIKPATEILFLDHKSSFYSILRNFFVTMLWWKYNIYSMKPLP